VFRVRTRLFPPDTLGLEIFGQVETPDRTGGLKFRAISVVQFIGVTVFFVPSLFTLVGVVTNKSMALYFVGEKHQRRWPFLSASRINRIEGFWDSCAEE